ncbi:DNA-binding response regulator [Nocardioides psychrotolerans]|uniref:DNA-binding response regulator, NarL/FixJ family, contains REC and HTH domains n=1 Tax=Nocardioides psychrotolerans TaxID=1005945 RepID=A0A1I3DQF7_9ACTN|nr:response regulator transcription factor [Nocardioides psychrotolerans]GEP40571.1 DNA-binding response regulator [Nocardioides psychrotolerans]SFH88965.1 DNA-binding response regulator, NarL/FixJ family, contains REC and HTH domains [Nocardioides psychrotolerans]
MDPTIRVAIVADGDVVHRGLESVVTELPDAVLVQGRTEGPALEAHADVVLYDVIGLRHGEDDQLTHLVKETDAAVVAVARELKPDLADRALEKGVDGVISLSATVSEIHEVVRAAALGDLLGDGSLASLDYTRNPDHRTPSALLSSRETDVIALVACGLSNEEISKRLYLSINTVKTYIRTAYRKIGVTSRSQAVGWAHQHGIH